MKGSPRQKGRVAVKCANPACPLPGGIFYVVHSLVGRRKYCSNRCAWTAKPTAYLMNVVYGKKRGRV